MSGSTFYMKSLILSSKDILLCTETTPLIKSNAVATSSIGVSKGQIEPPIWYLALECYYSQLIY